VIKNIWHSPNHFKLNELPLRNWLLDNTSLTQRLRKHCKTEFKVKLLEQNWQYPLAKEIRLLKLSLKEYVRIRHVYLYCQDKPCVFAKTLIPQSTLSGKYRRLARLGTLPLGTILFAHNSLQRSELQIARLQPRDDLYQLAIANLENPPPFLWARRSIFYLDNKSLLVYEVFLF
jgi:chorismate--pyruvate lyase